MPGKLLLYTVGLEEGGTEKAVERLALGLSAAQFEVGVAYSDAWGPVGDRLVAAGIPLVRFPARDRRAAEEAIRAFAPDLFHGFSHLNKVDLAAAADAGVPVLAEARPDVRHWDPAMEVKAWELERNRLTHRISAVSHAAAAMCTAIEGVPEEKITVIHNGVALPSPAARGVSGLREELALPPGAPLIGYVANYRPEKDHETLLRAFRLVLDRLPDTRLVCCGIRTPEREAELAALARELRLEGRAFLLPSRSAIHSVYHALDLYVHSSRFEGFSNSLIEAMAHGLPVAATAVGGTPEAVADGETGLLAPAGDAEALARAVTTLLSDPLRLRRSGAAGRARVEREFTADHMLAGYAAFYEKALRAGGSRRLRAAAARA